VSAPRTVRPRSERSDTKTLFRLGGESQSEPLPATAPEQEPSEALDPASESKPDDAGTQRSVQLWFKGIAEPVRARAELGDASLQLRAALPFLELESIVGVTTVEGGALLHGRIRRVAFEPGTDRLVPQLCVDVSLSDSIPPTPGIGAPELAASQAGGEADGAHARTATQSSRILGWLAALAVGAACGAGVAILWLAPPFSISEPARSAPARSAPPVAVAAAAPAPYVPAFDVAHAVEPPATEAELFADAPLAYVNSSPRADGRDHGTAIEPAAAVAHEPPLPRDDATSGAADGTPAASGTRPEVTVQGWRTRVFVPMEGDDRGLRQYELTTPGVAVTVPHARALVPIDNYAIHRGIVRRVWLRQEPDGLQVRVITRRPSSRAIASFDASGLTILLDP
jgi:hypothetical protein